MRGRFWYTYGDRVISIFFVIVIITIMACSTFFVPAYSCKQKATKQGLEYDWGILQGCMVKGIETNNKWVDYDRLRIFDAKE